MLKSFYMCIHCAGSALSSRVDVFTSDLYEIREFPMFSLCCLVHPLLLFYLFPMLLCIFVGSFLLVCLVMDVFLSSLAYPFTIYSCICGGFILRLLLYSGYLSIHQIFDFERNMPKMDCNNIKIISERLQMHIFLRMRHRCNIHMGYII